MKQIILLQLKSIKGYLKSIIVPSIKDYISLINLLIMYVNLTRIVPYRRLTQQICQNWISLSHRQTFIWIWRNRHYVLYWMCQYQPLSLRMIILYSRMVIFMSHRMPHGLMHRRGLIRWLCHFTLLQLLVRLNFTKIIRMVIVYNGNRITSMLMLRMLNWVARSK